MYYLYLTKKSGIPKKCSFYVSRYWYMILPSYKKIGYKNAYYKRDVDVTVDPEHKKINARFTQGPG